MVRPRPRAKVEVKGKTKVTKVNVGGLLGLVGQRVMLFCLNYIYEGRLDGQDGGVVELSDAHIVYETGAFGAKGYADSQKLHTDKWYVSLSSVESFGAGK